MIDTFPHQMDGSSSWPDTQRVAYRAINHRRQTGAGFFEVDKSTARDRLAEVFARDADSAAKGIFDVLREALGDPRDGVQKCTELLRAATSMTREVTNPRFLVNLLMATFSARASLGDDRVQLLSAVEARLADLLSPDRARMLVDRLR